MISILCQRLFFLSPKVAVKQQHRIKTGSPNIFFLSIHLHITSGKTYKNTIKSKTKLKLQKQKILVNYFQINIINWYIYSFYCYHYVNILFVNFIIMTRNVSQLLSIYVFFYIYYSHYFPFIIYSTFTCIILSII